MPNFQVFLKKILKKLENSLKTILLFPQKCSECDTMFMFGKIDKNCNETPEEILKNFQKKTTQDKFSISSSKMLAMR